LILLIIFRAFKSVHLDGELIFDRATEGRFPEVKELKQLIRDKIVPDKDLGHSDVQEVADTIQEEDDEDETLEQRRFFGVD
jgi:predicted Rdx family selenoprotein